MAEKHAAGERPAEEQTKSALTEQQELVKKARQYHRLRFQKQLAFWSFVIVTAAACIPFESWVVRSGAGAPCDALQLCPHNIALIANGFLLFLLIVFLIYHIAVEWQARIDWKDAFKSVGSLAKHEVVTEGFADFFDIYIRSKRRSYHLLAVGLLGLTYAIVGGALAVRHGLVWSPVFVMAGSGLVLAVGLVLLSYLIARSYLPGAIVAENTLLLCTIALQKDINIQDARKIVAEDIKVFVARKPWWFFN